MPTFTMRLPDADYEALQAMALLTDRPMAELVREAIVKMVADYVDSEDVESRLEEDLERRRRAATALLGRGTAKASRQLPAGKRAGAVKAGAASRGGRQGQAAAI